MASKKRKIAQPEIVQLFAQRLRERRHELGMTQESLAHEAKITTSYVWRLESGGASPGIDLVDRLAKALGMTVASLLPSSPPTDPLGTLREQARKLAADLVEKSDRETLQMLCPLLFRLLESQGRGR